MKKQQQQASRLLRRLASRRRSRRSREVAATGTSATSALPKLLRAGDDGGSPELADAIDRSSPVKARAQARRELALASSGSAVAGSAGGVGAAPTPVRPKSRSRFNLRRLASRRRQRDGAQAQVQRESGRQPSYATSGGAEGGAVEERVPSPSEARVHWATGAPHLRPAAAGASAVGGVQPGASLAEYDWGERGKQAAGVESLGAPRNSDETLSDRVSGLALGRQLNLVAGTATRFDADYRRKRQRERALRAHQLGVGEADDSGTHSGGNGSRVAAACAMAAAAAIGAATRASAAAAAAAAAVQMLRYSEDELHDELVLRRKQELRANFAMELQSGRFWLHPHKDQFVPVLAGPNADVVADSVGVWQARGLLGRTEQGAALPTGPDNAQPLAQLRDRKLASVFERHFDPVSCQHYFVNTQTMECSWSPPRHLRESGGGNGAMLVRFSDTWAAVRLQTAWRARNSRRAAARACCSIFDKLFDESSGAYYYWNKRTGESTWDRPANFPRHDGDPIWFDKVTRQLMDAEQAKLEQRDQTASSVSQTPYAHTEAGGAAHEVRQSAARSVSSGSDDDIAALRQHHSPDRRAFARTDQATGERKVLGWQGPVKQSSTSGRRRRRKVRDAKTETVHDRGTGASGSALGSSMTSVLRTDAAAVARGTYASYRETQLGLSALWRYLRSGDTLAAAEVLHARPELARLREGDEEGASSEAVAKLTEVDTRPYPLHYLCTHAGFENATHVALLRLLLKEAPEAAFATAIVRHVGVGKSKHALNGANDGADPSGSQEASEARNMAAFQALQAAVGETLAALLEPAAAQGHFNTGSIVTPPALLPLHLMCHNKSVAFDSLWELLVVNASSPSQAEPMFGLTPLHCLCLNPSVSAEKLRLILQFAGDAARRTCNVGGGQRSKASSGGGGGDKASSTVAAHLGRVRAARARFDGAFPIHLLCQNPHATPGMFEALHKNYKQAARRRTRSGATVLHYICSTRFKYSESSDTRAEDGPMLLANMIRAAIATQHDVDAGDSANHFMAVSEHARISDTARHANRQAADEASQATAGYSSQQLLALFEQEARRDAACRLAVANAEAAAAARAAGKPLPAPIPQMRELREPRGSRNFFTKAPPGDSPLQLLCQGNGLELPIHAANTALVLMLDKLPPDTVTIARGGASPLQLLCKNEFVHVQLLESMITAIDRQEASRGLSSGLSPQGKRSGDVAARSSAASGLSSMERAPFALLCSNRRVTSDLLRQFLEWSPEAAALREDGQVSFQADNLREETARAPLHSLCGNAAVVDVALMHILIEACPEAVAWREVRTGHTPLHKLCSSPGATHVSISILLEHFSDAAAMRSFGVEAPAAGVAVQSSPTQQLRARRAGQPTCIGGRTPLHCLCANIEAIGRELAYEMVRLLLEAHPAAAKLEDDESNKPSDLVRDQIEQHKEDVERAKELAEKEGRALPRKGLGQYVHTAVALDDEWLEELLRHAAGERTFGHRQALLNMLLAAERTAVASGELHTVTSAVDVESLWMRQKYTNESSEGVLTEGGGGDGNTLVRGQHASKAIRW